MKRSYNLFKNICLLTAIIFLTLFALEILYRGYQKITKNIPFTKSVEVLHHKQLGWRGRKAFGNERMDKYKIFIIGDSFTEGCGVGEQDMYYSVIKDRMGAELFIYGCGGYGTLQEYIVIDKYIDGIQPDLIILQVHSNDFINNSWELEKASFCNNCLMMRPYLINNKIEYLFPGSFGEQRVFLSAHSRLFYRIFCEIDKLCYVLYRKGVLHSVEDDINEKGMNFNDFRKSVLITEKLIERIKNRIGETPMVVLLASEDEPYFTQFKNIFTNNKIEFIETVAKRIREESDKGLNLTLPDGSHWNERGNRLAGDVIVEELTRMGYYIDTKDSQP